MVAVIEKYDGDGFNISQSVKINAELEDILSRLMAKMGYTKSGFLFRDLLWSSRSLLNRDTIGIPEEYQKVSLENQRDTKLVSQWETIGIPEGYQAVKPTETLQNTVVLHANTQDNTSVLHDNTQDNTSVVHDNTSVTQSNTQDNTSVIHGNTSLTQSNTQVNTSVELSSNDFQEHFTPAEISPEQFRLYVRRIEDENVKLKSALEIADQVLMSKIQEGSLSGLLYQSENAIHGLIAWVDLHFRQYFPNQNVPLMMLKDVRKIYSEFPHYKMPNQP